MENSKTISYIVTLILGLIIGIILGKQYYGIPEGTIIPRDSIEVNYYKVNLPLYIGESKIKKVPIIKLNPNIFFRLKKIHDTITTNSYVNLAENDTTFNFKDTLKTTDSLITRVGKIKIKTRYYFPPYNFFTYKIQPNIPFIYHKTYIPIRIKTTGFLNKISFGIGYNYGFAIDNLSKANSFIGIGIYYKLFELKDIF